MPHPPDPAGADHALERTRRALLVLTRCGEAILRATAEEELFAAVCRVIVETGGYRMCWVGIAEADERRTVRPVAWAGHVDGYLDGIDIVWSEEPNGRGPTGTAIREGRAEVGLYFATDQALAPWRAAALARGYATVAALPLAFGGQCIGAVSMYSADVAPIGEEELRFLRQLADDLAFGVHALRERAARARADAEREAALRALSAEQDRFRGLIERSSDLTLVLDAGETITFASPAAVEILGVPPEALVGRSGRELMHPEDAERTAAIFAALLAEPARSHQLEVRLRRGDGGWAQLEALARNMLDVPGIRGIVINHRDVAERNRLREQVQQAQRLEGLGRIAGGIAHDFNNLLTVILSCSRALELDLAEGRTAQAEDVVEIRQAGERARDLTRQLLAFARRQVIAPVPLDVNEVVRSSERLLRRVLGAPVELVCRLEPSPWTVRCDAGQLEQVVMNLAVNARDAMPAGGRLTVTTANLAAGPAEQLRRPGLAPGEYLRLTVEDTGTGMSPEVQRQAFEPFFTTKGIGRGTGLGLATVYGIVRQSGGFIRLDSEPGRGTAVEILLPRTAEAPAAQGTTPAPRSARGTETILLVEDDPAVREVAARGLRTAGYRVLVAAEAQEATAVLDRLEGALDLLVSDVVLPGVGGRELAATLRRARPGLPVLLMSGHVPGPEDREVLGAAGGHFIQKPFTGEVLASRVRSVLDGG